MPRSELVSRQPFLNYLTVATTTTTTTTTTMSLTPAMLCLAECDSCAQTLLADLERLDDDLTRIKGQLENASSGPESRKRLGELEKAISETKVARRRRQPVGRPR